MDISSVPSSLLIVIGEPLTEEHVPMILNRITDGLSAWNHNARGFLDYDKPQLDLNAEVRQITTCQPIPVTVGVQRLDTGGKVIRSSSPNLLLEVLLQPTVQTLELSLAQHLTCQALYKHVIHAGVAFAGDGSWLLSDGTFSFRDFTQLLHRADVSTALLEITKDSTLVVSCFPEGEWNEHGVKRHGLDKLGRISVGVLKGKHGLDNATAADLHSYLRQFVSHTPLDALLPSSPSVGSIRFARPTLYVFPAGQGEGMLFGVNGFTLQFDSGFGHKPCCWDFLRHVDRVDALLISRLNSSSVLGVSSFIDRLSTGQCRPKIGYTFGNIPPYPKVSTAEDQPRDPLLLSTVEEGGKILDGLARLNLKLHQCVCAIGPTAKHPEPLTLYQKVGEGRLDMYVLNPTKDSKEFSEFIESWKKGIYPNGPAKSTKSSHPMCDDTSIAVLLIWRPADPQEQIVRVLYPGSCPQEKILLGLDKLKHLDVLKHPTCTPASLEGAVGKSAGATAAVAKKKLPDVGKSAVSPRSTVSPAASKSPVPNATKSPVPNATKSPVPNATKSPVPNATKSPVPNATKSPVPNATKSPVPNATKSPVPNATKSPVPVVAAAATAAVPPAVAPVDPLVAAAVVSPESLTPQAPLLTPQAPLLDITTPTPEKVAPVHKNEEQHGFEQPTQEDSLLGDFNAPPVLSPMVEPTPQQVSGAGAETAVASPDVMEKHAGGLEVGAEPAASDLFGLVNIPPPMEAGVLHLSKGQLQEYQEEDNVAEQPSLTGESQNENTFYTATSPDAFSCGAQRMQESPDVLVLENDNTIEHNSKSDLFSTSPVAFDQPTLSPQPESPDSAAQRQLSALNPEAPVFIPKIGPISPTEDPFKSQDPFKNDHAGSPLDPFPSLGENPGNRTSGLSGFSNGSADLLGDTPWPTEGAGGAEQSPDEQRKKMDEVMKEWGGPLGLPAPSPATGGKGTTPTNKTKANGPASGSGSKTNKPGSASASATAATKRTTTAAAAPKPTAATAAKSGTQTKPAQPSGQARPAAASATAAKKSPAASTLTANANTAPTRAAAAKSSASATAAKAPSAGRPATTASKTTAASKAPAAAAKKPGPPAVSYYVDLTYVPHQGNPQYVNEEFFKHVRAKYYVLSTLQPSKQTLDALLNGKKAWNLPEEEVALIPTYDSDTLTLWMGLHKDELASESIDVAPSCCRCTVNLEQDESAKCAAYRLEL